MTGSGQTERLASRAIAGDRPALDELWRAHRRWTAAVLLAHAPRTAEVEDLLQEVALRIVRSIDSLSEPAAFLPWLRSIALNVARSAGRRRAIGARLLRPLASGDEQIADGEPPRRDAARAESSRVLAQLELLEPEYREPLLLRGVEGMSQRDIAAILGVPVTTVESRLARARRALRAALERTDGPSPRVPSKEALR